MITLYGLLLNDTIIYVYVQFIISIVDFFKKWVKILPKNHVY